MSSHTTLERHDVESDGGVHADGFHERSEERFLDALSFRRGGLAGHCGNVNWITIALAAVAVGLVIYSYLAK